MTKMTPIRRTALISGLTVLTLALNTVPAFATAYDPTTGLTTLIDTLTKWSKYIAIISIIVAGVLALASDQDSMARNVAKWALWLAIIAGATTFVTAIMGNL